MSFIGSYFIVILEMWQVAILAACVAAASAFSAAPALPRAGARKAVSGVTYDSS